MFISDSSFGHASNTSSSVALHRSTQNLQSSSSRRIPFDEIMLSDSEDDVKPVMRTFTANFDLWEAGHIQELMEMAKQQRLELKCSLKKKSMKFQSLDENLFNHVLVLTDQGDNVAVSFTTPF